MSISQKLIPIECNKELLSDRFRHLVSFIDNFKICRFQIKDWSSPYIINRINETSFIKLLKEYMKAVGYWFEEDSFGLNNTYDSDLSEEEFIIILYNDLYYGILTTCCEYEAIVDTYEEILSNLDPKITPVKAAKSSIPGVTSPLQFMPYEV